MSEVEKRKMVSSNKYVLIVAWTAMLLASSLAVIIWRELTQGMPSWWPWVHAIGLLVLLFLSFVYKTLKTIRKFLLIFIIIFYLGFGGGWDWGFIPFVRSSTAWINWTSQAPWALEAIGTHLLRLTPALVILLMFLMTGRRREDFFIVWGTINAPVEPSKLLGMKEPEPWTRIGPIFASIFTVVTFIFLLFTTQVTLEAFVLTLPLIPVALLIAVINAFNEEFTLRAAPLSEILPSIGKQQALLITTVFFGLGHFYGIPNGVLGVLLSAFLGWFLGKSILETKGFFWAWLIHFLPDAFIFSFLAIVAL